MQHQMRAFPRSARERGAARCQAAAAIAAGGPDFDELPKPLQQLNTAQKYGTHNTLQSSNLGLYRITDMRYIAGNFGTCPHVGELASPSSGSCTCPRSQNVSVRPHEDRPLHRLQCEAGTFRDRAKSASWVSRNSCSPVPEARWSDAVGRESCASATTPLPYGQLITRLAASRPNSKRRSRGTMHWSWNY